MVLRRRRNRLPVQNLKSHSRSAMTIVRSAGAALMASAALCFAQSADNSRPEQYMKLCAGCHGEGATGSERGPALLDNRSLRSRSQKQIHDLIQNGTPSGMPAFALPEDQLQPLARWVRSLNASAYDLKPAGNAASGERFFFGKGQCGSCHMARGIGNANGPDLSSVGRASTSTYSIVISLDASAYSFRRSR